MALSYNGEEGRWEDDTDPDLEQFPPQSDVQNTAPIRGLSSRAQEKPASMPHPAVSFADSAGDTGRLKKLKARRKGPGFLCRLVQLVTILSVAFSLVALGFACCCLPITTQLLAESTSNYDESPYGPEILVNLAQLTRDYTVGGSGYQALCEAEVDAALTYYEEEQNVIPEFLLNAVNAVDSVTAAQTLAFFDDSLALNEEAVSHLDDVHRVIIPAIAAFAIALVISILLLVFLGIRHGRRQVGIPLIIATSLVLALFILLLCWALVDFDGFFAALHSLFFADGSWTFDPQSLLITMYPEAFWMGMGIVWVSISLLSSLIFLVAGILTVRNS